MEYSKYKAHFFEEYFEMAKVLFPNYSRKELKKDLEHAVSSEKHETFFAIQKETIMGFVNVSVRSDYVEGATSSPVGYLEALFVKPEFRKQGIAKYLSEIAEKWAVAQGCSQMGSDTWDWNKSSIEFHKKIGFKEEDILVHFIKDIRK
ncbi:MAG: aminoglycoside 6'-N-acetyltransferase [Flavobacteriaceae bacterium]